MALVFSKATPTFILMYHTFVTIIAFVSSHELCVFTCHYMLNFGCAKYNDTFELFETKKADIGRRGYKS